MSDAHFDTHFSARLGPPQWREKHIRTPPHPPTPFFSPGSGICRHVSAAQSLSQCTGSLTAQYRSFINQRHFQCPITETQLLALSEADSPQIHLLGGKRRPGVHTCSSKAVKTAGRPFETVFSRSGKQQKKVNCLSQVTLRFFSPEKDWKLATCLLRC